MDKNKIKEMIQLALSKPVPERINSKEYISNRKSENPIDTITMDVPLFIRMMEFSREDAKSDLDLHDVAEKAISLSNNGKTLTMSDYETMFGGSELDEKKLTAAEKRKKEDIVMAMKKSFKGNKGVMYAIATDKAKKLAESDMNEAQPSSNESLAKKVEEVVKSLTILHKNTSNNSNIPETDKKGLLRAFDMLKGDLEVVFTNLKREGLDKMNEVNLKASKLSSAEYQKAKKLKDFKASDWKWNTDEDLYTKVNEGELTEAYVPDNIKKFAKERGVSSLVNKVAGWAEKVRARITGGTAIGKNYSTLILDMGYQTGDIRINTEDETIELYGEEVNSFPEFKEVYMDKMTQDQIEHDEYTFRQERGLEEGLPKGYWSKKIPKGKMEEGMGNEVGDVVYFKGDLGEKYPASQGYYGVIEDVIPASNYNMLATYQVVVCDENDDEVGIVNTSFLNLSSKLKISTPKLKSMAETIMSKLKGK